MERPSKARSVAVTKPGLVLPRPRRRLHFVRFIALVTGLLAVVGLSASIYGYVQIGRAERIIRTQVNESADTFTQVATSLQTASDSALHAGVTVDDAQSSLTSASTTLTDLAGTLDQSGSAINVAIPGLGVRPFAGVQSNFRDQATEFRDLAKTVDSTRDAFGGNATDLRTIGTTVSGLAVTMRARARQLHAFSDGDSGANLASITTPIRVLVAYSILMHLLLLGIGASLFVLTTPGHHPIALTLDNLDDRDAR